MKYYSTQRPVAPGTFPKPDGNKVLEIVNFDERQYCREAGRDCWGYIEYEKPLTEKQAMDYELVRDVCFIHNHAATPSSADGGHSLANPWDAPGMGVPDFI